MIRRVTLPLCTALLAVTAFLACSDEEPEARCQEGATRPADDGCNTCVCTDGDWECTLLGCEDDTLSWYTTCGDPVCGPDANEPTGERLCADGETEAARCDDEGALCDPGIGCGTNLVCAASDPKLGIGGCPISRASFKRDIEYLSDAERQHLSDLLLATPLATFSYRAPQSAPQLGFVIEDVEPSPAVDGPRDRVNLYGYTSMAVAALQEQALRIERLERRVEMLSAELAEKANRCSSD